MQFLGIYMGGLNTTPAGAGAENVEPVIVRTGGSPLPQKREPTTKKRCNRLKVPSEWPTLAEYCIEQPRPADELGQPQASEAKISSIGSLVATSELQRHSIYLDVTRALCSGFPCRVVQWARHYKSSRCPGQ